MLLLVFGAGKGCIHCWKLDIQQVAIKMMKSLDLPTMEGTISMPMLGLGTWQVSDEAVISSALNIGYPLLDTACIYQNEPIVGSAVQKANINREDIFITSKLWCTFMSHRDHVREAVDRSLQALCMDYMDLYLIHSPCAMQYQGPGTLMPSCPVTGNTLFTNADLVQTWKALEECVEEGKIKAIGLSNFNASQIERIVSAARVPVANLQVEIHGYLSQKPLSAFCKDRGITLTSYGSLGSPGAVDIQGLRSADAGDVDLLSDPVVTSLATKHGHSPAQVLLRQLVQRNIAVIPKSSNIKRLKQNMQIFDFNLDEEDMNRLDKLNRNQRTFVDTDWSVHPEYPFHAPF